MRSRGTREDGGDSSDDTSRRLLPPCGSHSVGSGSGANLRISSAFGETAASPGHSVPSHYRVDGGLVCLCPVPGRPADGIHSGHGRRRYWLGGYRRTVAQAPFFLILEEFAKDLGLFVPSWKKILPFCEKYVCIWGKMGYNKVDIFFDQAKRKHP